MATNRQLTRNEAVAIRRWYEAGYRVKEIAERAGVTQATVSRIVHGHTHKRYRPIAERNLPPLPQRRKSDGDDPKRRPAAELARWMTRRR